MARRAPELAGACRRACRRSTRRSGPQPSTSPPPPASCWRFPGRWSADRPAASDDRRPLKVLSRAACPPAARDALFPSSGGAPGLRPRGDRIVPDIAEADSSRLRVACCLDVPLPRRSPAELAIRGAVERWFDAGRQARSVTKQIDDTHRRNEPRARTFPETASYTPGIAPREGM